MSDDEHGQEKAGFKVQDRRRFSESGDLRPEHRDEPAPSDAAPSTEVPPAAPHSAPAAEINFSTFIIGLSTQALAHLGEIVHPIDQQSAVDFGAAKQLIDILGILKDKTRGNLDKPEADLLEGLLYDLRVRYVERVRGTERT
jgi:hypothetical protein